MARETRGSAIAAADPAAETIESSAAPKRKRQPSSTQTDAPRPISLKVTLPAQNSTASGGPRVKLTVSPTKADSEQAQSGAKRQRISLKVKGGKKKKGADAVNGEEGPNGVEVEGKEGDGAVEEEGGGEEDASGEMEEEVVVKEEKKVVARLLDSNVRDALAVVLGRMAVNLPRPLNGVLTLFLPPSFAEKQENTLGFILSQTDLTWERLVDLLHIFSVHLLKPCAYPSPFPPLSHIHTSIPPLPPHQPPHVIYDFCASMRDLILSIEPTTEPGADGATVEKWGLMMKVPGGTEGRGAGEWWTSVVDWREVEKVKEGAVKGEEDEAEGLLARLAADGTKFGFANAVSVSSFAGTSTGLATAPKLGDSIIRRASLKAQRWKEQLARRKGGFGSVQRPVTVPRVSSLPWTPSFAPTFDSNYASGGVGYWTTLEAMHQRNRYKGWTNAGARKEKQGEAGEGYWGNIDSTDVDGIAEEAMAGTVAEVVENGVENGVKEERKVEDVLQDHAEWLDELLGWQELRVRRGEKVPGEREQVLAEELLNSLSTLSSGLPPSSLLPSLPPGFAHTLSKRFIPTPGPIIRGTLDPRRPRAIHDSTTIRPRPSTSMPPMPTPGSMSNPPSIAQQLAGTPTRSMSGMNGLPPSGGGGYTPTPAGGFAPPRTNSGYGYASTPTANGIPSSSRAYPTTQQLLGQAADYRATPPPSRPSYTHTPYHPGLLPPAGNNSNTIYSRGSPVAGQGQGQQVTMAGGYGGRPGMMPSGLRQSFGPGTEGASGSGSGAGSPAVQGQGGGYFASGSRG